MLKEEIIMTIEYTTKSKLESLALSIPNIYAKLLTCPEDAEYVLLAKEDFPVSYYVAAITIGDDILYISDEDYREIVQKFISGTN